MITIHRAKVEDVYEIKKLLFNTWTATYSNIYSPEAIELITSRWHSVVLLTKQIKNPSLFFSVAKDGNKIVGMCNATLTQGGKVINIQRLHIIPEYQRRGIGSKLIEEVIKTFPKALKIELEVEKQNERALTFYQKQGFQRIGKKTFEIASVHMTCVVMEKLV
ncbi:MAG: N-acetyltransferase [Candidatus Roizmanbacteria bacterium]|nr:N-acetyltransferase [Candidatus Roizmanbacteria bacterium]